MRPVSDKRVDHSKAKVLAETYRQLAQAGVAGFSIDEVSRSCGVSKTTIYRHWPSRSALIIDACSRLGTVTEAPDTGSFQGDVRTLLTGLALQLQTENWSAVYPSIIDAAERDPEIRALQADLHNAFMTPFETAVERAKARGEISTGRATADLVALLVGPLFFRRWFSREAIDDGFIEATIKADL